MTFFNNIVGNLGIEHSEDECRNVYHVDSLFNFVDDMPTLEEVVKMIGDIDVSKSICVINIISRFCKEMTLALLNIG